MIPLLDRYPHAFVVAVDISTQLLAILRDHLAAHAAYRGRYALVCMDASIDRYRAGAFDLAVGAAILHHVIEPRQVIAACARALRPGGAALFFEPFALGHALLALAYRAIVAEAKRRRERAPGITMLVRLLRDYTVRMRDKPDRALLRLDDKWMFSRSFFEAAMRDAAWADCRMYPINGAISPLTDQTRINLRLGMGAEESALPRWAWQRLAEYESAFPDEARRDLIFEGAVILSRSDAQVAAPDSPRAGWWWNPNESGRGFFVAAQGDRLRIAALVYDAGGAPVWHAFAAGSDAEKPPVVPFSWSFDGPCKARVVWGGASIDLQPQHEGHAPDARTGWWTEDGADSAIVVEGLGERVAAALLAPDGWSFLSASRRAGHSFVGDWLRFTGGQTITGVYRAPAAPEALGEARLFWVDQRCLVAHLPDGRRRFYSPLAFA